MNSSIVLINDFVLATPLEQFQILPLGTQSYTSTLPMTSIETANLFPQVAEADDFVYLLGGSALFTKVTSWDHHAWLDLYSAVPSYLASGSSAEWMWMSEAPTTTPGVISLLLTGFSMTVSSIAYALFAIYVTVATLLSVILNIVFGIIFLPFTLLGGSTPNFGAAAGLLQITDFIQGVFAGQLVAGSLFTNFMLITILGFISMKLFISFSLYETKLVPTRWQAVFEMMYGTILAQICDTIGAKKGEKYFPAFFTLFLVVLGANVIALFPYTYSITSQMIVTFTISLFAFTAINIIGFLHHGLFLFGMLLPKGVPLAMAPALVFIETLSYVARVVSLALRIFANILSGHIMLKIMTIAIWFIFAFGGVGYLIHGFALSVVVVINILECGVAVVQAAVFTLLCAIYTNDAIEGGH
jgi:ATP synthase subunit 6